MIRLFRKNRNHPQTREGFTNLMRNTDIIPDRYSDILNKLKRISTNFEAINDFARSK